MKKNFCRRVASLLMALILCVGFVPPVQAAGTYSKSQLDSLLAEWNNGEYAQNQYKSYGGAIQCAAFTRFLFDRLWGHYDREGEAKNYLMPYGYDDIPCSTEAELMSYLKNYAKPGDSFRISQAASDDCPTHIMHLYDIDASGNLHIYESNFEGNSRNKARYKVLTLKDLVQTQTALASVYDNGSFSRPVYLTIIHASNNTATQFSSSCAHNYAFSKADNDVVCSKCKKAYSLPELTYAPAYKRISAVNKDSKTAPAHVKPYGDAKINEEHRYKLGETVFVLGYLTNYYGNTWYKLATGEWVTGDYLGEHYHITNSKGFCDLCLSWVNVVTMNPTTISLANGKTSVPVHFAPYGASLKWTQYGSTVTVNGKAVNKHGNIWYRTTEGAWVFSDYLHIPEQTGRVKNVSGGLALNDAPASSPNNSRELASVPAGSMITIYPNEASGKWTSAYYNGQVGYVYGTYITVEDAYRGIAAPSFEEPGLDIDSSSTATPAPAPTPSPAPSTVSVSVLAPTDPEYTKMISVSDYSATVVANIRKSAGSKVTACGLWLYDENGNLIKKHTENISNVGDNNTNFHCWYDIFSEVGVTLASRTTYQYRFFVVVNGTTYQGDLYSFTTTGPTPVIPPEPAPAPSVYRMTLDANGGICSVSYKDISANTAIGTLPVPTRNGYTFNGWYTAAESGVSISESTRYDFNGNTTVYAHWTPNKYRLTLEPNGGTATVPYKDITFDTVIGTLTPPTRDGYTFDGWYSAAEGGNPIRETMRYNADFNVTIYAHWKPNTYRLTLNPNGGTTTAPYKDIVFDTTIGTLTAPTRTGYTFAGWYSAAEGGNPIRETMRYNAPFDVTIYAHWNNAAPVLNPFTDVPKGTYYHDAVLWAKLNNVTGGTSATTFSPDIICTRSQVVTFLWSSQGKPEPKTKVNPFVDVKESDWFYKPVLWAVEQGITSGTSATTFSPNTNCTTGQVLTFLWASNGKPAAVTTDTAWYAKAVAWANNAGLLGNMGPFSAANLSPRSEIVTYLYRNAGSPSITTTN